ncbi:bifunctional endoribonuclease/protein kinase ire1 [Knufia fluminis]|uniref:non-specific serine/threonine protein kinase n=1 Tax=Knufia fluminis TaxID=191047 RepID=A0AAN8I3J3_9EURO|nr:bifunctional endoribonuclease/protein kinase ire1 [Knufia fluminis]
MVTPSRRPRGGGMASPNKWLSWTLLALYAGVLPVAASSSTSGSASNVHIIASGSDPPLPAPSRIEKQTTAGRSPAEIPLLNHEIPTAKFRNTNEEVDERYHALAPASYKPAVRAPVTQQSTESQALSLPDGARSLLDWEADDIVLLSTIDGALHARDRRTGRKRWTLRMPEPMIQAEHYRQNRSDSDELQVQDDYIFIVEPSSDGQLYAQFSDPRIGLYRLPATVRKMATEVPFSMHLNGQYLATTSQQESKAYTIDATTGDILHEFPRSKSSIKSDPQPRCRPRSGLNFEDPACRPGRTLRLGRNTYIFTISNEETGQDLCTIRFSEWVTNKMDHDLQNQHTTSFDGYDLRVFHNGWAVALDTTAEPDKQHIHHFPLDSPVARIFDIARNSDDDESDPVILSRSADFIPSEDVQLLRQDPNINQRVFINRTQQGQWFAMSEQSYPGVTSTAKLANVQQQYFTEPLDLHGDMKDIVGVHLLSDKQPMAQQRLTIGPSAASNSNSDLISEPPKALNITGENDQEGAAARWSRFSDTFLGAVLMLVACVLMLSGKDFYKLKQLRSTFSLPEPQATSLALKAPDVILTSKPPSDHGTPPDLAVATDLAADAETDAAVDKIITPSHSRVQSTVSLQNSPGREDDVGSEAEAESEDENGPQEKKRKKTKRGGRGGRRNKKKGDATTFEPKPVVSQEKHLKDGMVQVGRLAYDSKLENCLGQGSSGTAVFPGTFDGRLVAVKRLVKTANSLAEKEIRHLVSSDEHPNVIRYHGKEESPSFFYIALDKFDTSLDQFVEFYDKFPTLVSPARGYDVRDALRQITRGVQHLHSLKLVHRDIKPQNILVRPIKSNRALPDGQLTPLLFVISDFGLCKPLEDGPDSVFAATRTAAGTTGWKAPELLVSSRDAIAAPLATTSESAQSTVSQSYSQSHSRATASSSTSDGPSGTVIDPPSGRRATKAIDIFSLGCVFFYVLTRGAHPFDRGGSPLARDLNIRDDKYDTSLLRDSFVGYDYDADDLIMQMIMHNPKARPDTSGVLSHPYFWKVEHKLDFLCAVSDNYEERKQKIVNIHDENAPRSEFETNILTELAALQQKAPNVIGLKHGVLQDWLNALPKSFLNEMGKQRKYTGTKMIDLLRVIRNKKNHFHDLPTEVKDMMIRRTPEWSKTPQIEGYYAFWRDRFPSILVNCHQLLQERGLVQEFGLERYYEGGLA